MVKTIFLNALLLGCLISSVAQAEESLRDPTRPLGHVAEARGDAPAQRLQLQSILYSDARKLAYINGQAVMEQETLPGTQIKVLRIQPEAVTLQGGGKTWRLTLDTLDVRQSSRDSQP